MSRKPFVAIDNALAIDDDTEAKIDAYAERAGIPTLAKPTRQVKTPEPKPVPAPANKAEKPVWVSMPEYVSKALKRQAFENDCSIRYLLLKALHESGTVEIDAADLVRDRRTAKAG